MRRFARPPSSTSTSSSSSTTTLRLALRPAAAYTTSTTTSKPLDFGKDPSKSRPMSSSYQDVLSSHPPKKLHVRWPGLPGWSHPPKIQHAASHAHIKPFVPYVRRVGCADMMQEGQELHPDQTARMPTVCWDGDENDFHTLGTPPPPPGVIIQPLQCCHVNTPPGLGAQPWWTPTHRRGLTPSSGSGTFSSSTP